MLDASILKILSGKIGDHIRTDLASIELEASKIYSDFARRNILSPGALHQVAGVCCDHIKKRSEFINSLLMDLSERGILLVTIENKNELLEIIKGIYVSDITAMKGTMNRPMLGKIDTTRYFEEAIHNGLERIESELEVLMLTRKETSAPSQTITLYNYGTIGAFQSGTQITATVNQEIEIKKEKLVAALNEIKNKVEDENIENSNDIVETIDDGINELSQESINYFRLQGHLMMLMTTLQTLPNLKPAVAVLAQAYDYYFGTSIGNLLK